MDSVRAHAGSSYCLCAFCRLRQYCLPVGTRRKAGVWQPQQSSTCTIRRARTQTNCTHTHTQKNKQMRKRAGANTNAHMHRYASAVWATAAPPAAATASAHGHVSRAGAPPSGDACYGASRHRTRGARAHKGRSVMMKHWDTKTCSEQRKGRAWREEDVRLGARARCP